MTDLFEERRTDSSLVDSHYWGRVRKLVHNMVHGIVI